MRGFLMISSAAALACAATFVPPARIAPAAATATDAFTPEPAVRIGADGRLVYATDARGNRIPDFSNAGYGGGGVALPVAPVKDTLAPADGDAGARIQAAIDRVSQLPADAHGLRGAVLLKKGTYRLAGSLRIAAGGVVLRGEGQGADGTVLLATGTAKRDLITIAGEGAAREDADTRQPITDDYVPVGARVVHVARGAAFRVGDSVIVHRPSTAEWIQALGMDHIPPRKDGGKIVQWAPGSKDLRFDRVITAIAGEAITLDAPITTALDREYGGGTLARYAFPGRIAQAGVEDLRGDSAYSGPEDEAHAVSFIVFDAIANGWVRRITALHFVHSAVMVKARAKWITVEESACLDPISKITGSRRYPFEVLGQLTLVARSFARNGRHDFVLGSLSAGPNVFLDSASEQAHADTGPHHRWSSGALFDNIALAAGAINIRNRSNMGTGHGWAGANMVIWNSSAPSIICEKPPTAQNWAIGCRTPSPHGDGHWESLGTPVRPRSLYVAQLDERLGGHAGVDAAPILTRLRRQ